MQKANCTLVLNQVGSSVELTGVTPAEVIILNAIHDRNQGRVTDIRDITEDKSISNASELKRLNERFGEKKVKAQFPSATAKLPSKFEEQVPKPAIEDDDEPVLVPKSPITRVTPKEAE